MTKEQENCTYCHDENGKPYDKEWYVTHWGAEWYVPRMNNDIKYCQW